METFNQVVNQTTTDLIVDHHHTAATQHDNTIDTTTAAINVLQTINDESLLVATPHTTAVQDSLLSTTPISVQDQQAADISSNNNDSMSLMDTSGGMTPRPVKHRPTFTEDQITSMERVFSQRQYLSPMERETLAGNVSLSPQQVRVWFQNRRQKVKQFLTQRQIRNGPLLQNGEKQDNNSTTDAVITAQQLSNNIDPILQMLLPKVTGLNNNSQTTTTTNTVTMNEENEEEGEKGDERADTNDDSNNEKNESMEETTNVPSLSLSPSQQISLTPFLLPLTGTSTIQLTGGVGGQGNITIPAIQLIQSLLSSSLPKITNTTNKISPIKAQVSGSGLSVPLKATSPTPIDDNIDEQGTEIKSEESNNILTQPSSDNQQNNIPSTSELAPPTSSELAPPTSSSLPIESKQEETTVQGDSNPVLTTVSSEILSQLLGLTSAGGNEGLKTTWNLSVSPSQSGSISGGGVTATSTGITIDIPRRKRQVFSGVQTTELEKQFESCSYIDSKERDKLAEKIGLHPDQVKVWFQNRRTKRSRQAWRQKNVLEQ